MGLFPAPRCLCVRAPPPKRANCLAGTAKKEANLFRYLALPELIQRLAVDA
jgi:hypothetical protein